MAVEAEKSICNSVDRLGELATWLSSWVEEHKVNSSIAYKMRFAMEEIATNAVFYGFPTGDSGTVTVRVSEDTSKQTYSLEILDDGAPFNPLEDAPPNTPADSLDDLEPGGLGIFMVKNLGGVCSYVRENGWNHLTIVLDGSTPN
jgi:serine/threonine-protein kinase RsbW